MADVIPFCSVFIIPFESNASIKPNKIYFTHNKENSIRNIFLVLMFQQLLASKHHRLRGSKWPSKGLGLVADKTKHVQSKNRTQPMAMQLITSKCR